MGVVKAKIKRGQRIEVHHTRISGLLSKELTGTALLSFAMAFPHSGHPNIASTSSGRHPRQKICWQLNVITGFTTRRMQIPQVISLCT